MGERWLPLLLAPLLLGAESQATFFVPALPGAITLDLMLEGHGLLGDPVHGLPTTSVRFDAGYLHYLDGHGRAAVGGYVGGGASVGDDGPAYARVDVGATFRLRGISDNFYHGTLAFFGEVGLLAAPGRAVECPECETVASRIAGGVETGVGLLWYLDPYIFGESVARLGVESVRLDGRRVTAVFAALRLALDFTFRGRDP